MEINGVNYALEKDIKGTGKIVISLVSKLLFNNFPKEVLQFNKNLLDSLMELCDDVPWSVKA